MIAKRIGDSLPKLRLAVFCLLFASIMTLTFPARFLVEAQGVQERMTYARETSDYTETVLLNAQAPTPIITDLDWQSDASVIAIGSGYWDGNFQSCVANSTDIMLLDVSSNQLKRILRPDAICSTNSVDFHPDNVHLAVSSNAVENWNVQTQERVAAVTGPVFFANARWNPDGSQILETSIAFMSIMESQDLTNMQTIFSIPASNLTARFIYSDWSLDGQRIASSMNDGRIYVWNVVDEQILTTFAQHSVSAKRLAWHPIENMIASGDDNGNVWVWNPVTGESEMQLVGHTGAILDVDWRSDGQQIATVSLDNTLRVWDYPSGEMQIIDSERVFSAVAYSPDGTQLAYGGEITDVENPVVEIIPTPNLLNYATATASS